MEYLSRKELVSRADLHYHGMVPRREGGLPVGNGQMGSLVFTSPSAVKLAINRADVFAACSATNSFNRRHSDYGYACGFLDLDFVDYGEDVFDQETVQRLSLYEACATISGRGVSASVFAEEDNDAFVIYVKDEREYCGSVQAKLTMMRPAEFQTLSNLAVSELSMHNGVMVLKQEFKEDGYYCASAVAVWAEGGKSVLRMNDERGGREPAGSPYREVKVLGQSQETQMRLCMEPGIREFTLYAVSAATFDEKEDITESVLKKARHTSEEGRQAMWERHTARWREYWEKSYVRLESEDRLAEKIEMHYTYFFYLMESASKGKYPPNFGGMIFSPCGDYRHWGTMQWWNNLSLYYNPILASGHYELMKPLFSMYGGMEKAARTAARQQWGAEGMYLPEVTWFNGPEELPEEIAAEMQALYLFEKPWEERSEAFKEFVDRKAPHESRYNYKSYEHYEKGRVVYQERGYGPYGATTYMFGSQAGIAYFFWSYYVYTGDMEFLRKEAYPVIKGVGEFYMSLPLVKKAEDGLYHLYRTCTDESYYGCTDGMENIAGMHAILPVLLKAARILDADKDKWEAWEEFYRHLAPIPTTDLEDSVFKTEAGEPVLWSCGREPVLAYDKGTPSLYPCDHFDLSEYATMDLDPERYKISINTLEQRKAAYGLTSPFMVSEMSGCVRMYAAHGLAEDFKEIAGAQLDCINAEKEYCYYNDTGRIPFFENRLTIREGVNCISAQRLGNVAAAVQLALCQSSGGSPDADPAIKLFAAVPADWNAEFSLWCRGGFLVTAAICQGKIDRIVIRSRDGNALRLYNPFGRSRIVSGEGLRYEGGDRLIEISTGVGEELEILEV